jgi:hypothetical protein
VKTPLGNAIALAVGMKEASLTEEESGATVFEQVIVTIPPSDARKLTQGSRSRNLPRRRHPVVSLTILVLQSLGELHMRAVITEVA